MANRTYTAEEVRHYKKCYVPYIANDTEQCVMEKLFDSYISWAETGTFEMEGFPKLYMIYAHFLNKPLLYRIVANELLFAWSANKYEVTFNEAVEWYKALGGWDSETHYVGIYRVVLGAGIKDEIKYYLLEAEWKGLANHKMTKALEQ